MKRLIFLILFTNFYLVAYNQIIKGTILDIKTKAPISYASVYFNGTSVGIFSDIKGNFIIDISKYHLMPLSISSLGYYSVTESNFPTDKPLTIYMTPKVNELNEVVISATSLVRKRKVNLKKFKNEFLGTSAYAQNCVILNEKDITFNFGNDKDTLKAFASKPILIENKALGYKITYYLDKFEFYKKSSSFFYKGSLIFKEDTAVDVTTKQLYESRRINSYYGSRMHFFRVLWADSLSSEGFTVKNSDDKVLSYNEIVFQDDSNKKFLKYDNTLSIYFGSLSKINFAKEKVYFDKNGYFDELGIKWNGELAKKRIADLLPYDYSPK
jgi:hypothetical protein